ncbi:hypothetical protein FNW02_16940 [Komarekiella sp. 'clone 1']|uniref:Uncharacterized protein n=1 Tax=Komarekiella delphini-convector SJRDD-AB1 TaxID=2593771 RepID=A0AA40SYK7_9NOST|nr:hypothetical protein [Komarekiella delphini-convector]MBD6617465.1 hypothetical protein [Komarekiella delphini-convector SJRDD-AB1]
MTDKIKVCSVPVLLNSEQPHDVFSVVLVIRSRWENGKTLRVRFLDGDPVVQSKVEYIAH